MLSAVIVAAGLLALAGPATSAEAAELPDSIIDGGFIISDQEFFDGASMTVEEIQAFLDSKVPTCSSGATCLKNFTQTNPAKAADQYCAAIAGGTNETAASIIHKVANACGINPKVILVMLQKEQSLVTLTNPSQARFDRAMGFACPDSGPNNTANCDANHYGFANQVYRGARQMQVYTKNPNSFNYKPGQVNTIKWHPSTDCGTSRVYIQNRATANLYIYTPYRANIAALAAGTATGDSCSSYGNRNFYNFYVSWFVPEIAPPSGAPAQVPDCTQPPAADIATHSVTATVKSNTLNVRRAPTTKCTQDMVLLTKGAVVAVTGQYGAWSRATVGDAVAWLSTESLTFPGGLAPSAHVGPCAAPSGDNIVLAGGEFLTTSASLNARIAPTTSCSIGSTTLKKDTKVTRLGTYGVWWLVKVGSKTWWVHSDYLKPAYLEAFVDVLQTHQFATEIAWLAASGVSTGYTTVAGQQFRPANTVTRDAMAAFLYRFAGEPEFTPPETSPFRDVSASHQFYRQITWLAASGISTGWEMPDGLPEFRPSGTVTRDAMAAFMYRFAGEPEFTPPDTSPFREVEPSHQFYPQITWLAASGVSTGWSVTGGQEFRPANTVTRDAMAAFLYRLYAYLED